MSSLLLEHQAVTIIGFMSTTYTLYRRSSGVWSAFKMVGSDYDGCYDTEYASDKAVQNLINFAHHKGYGVEYS